MRRFERYVSVCVIGGLIFSSSMIFAGGVQEDGPEIIEESEELLEEAESPEELEEAIEELLEQSSDEVLEADIRMAESEGIVITGIIEDSAAQRAGLLRGDIILTVEGLEVTTLAEITDIVSELNHGDDISIGITRGGEDMVISLTLESRIGWPLLGIYGMGPQEHRGMGSRNGMNFDMEGLEELFEEFGGEGFSWGNGPMNSEGRGFFLDEDIPEEYLDQITSGDAAIVSEVVAESPAEAGGIETGAVIFAVDGQTVSEGDLKSAILAYESDDTVTLTVYQSGEILELEVTLGDADGNPLLGVRYYPAGNAERNQQFRGGGNVPGGLPKNDFNRMDG